ncbi:hypothetical protein LOTGIDRAFT_229992 [Lottia gigantea]|uniref:CHHC U11-48K-type domain-containing protein n=1 Tax=Lottia gigantea TaxID=225164 RepID=V4B3I6_LOTGI|nr:hypothetical protein LOTGIDRAFT_229992 [Lottia gigantea]ESP04918.1 hypothetical protein LOTGIDRAFT_229992 [Lottia gigantea]
MTETKKKSKYKMAHYNQQDTDERIPCPYNKFEMITVRRMPQHLIRCPHKNETEFETCPYNAIHIIPRSDYRQHLTTCPTRVVAEKAINYELEKQSDNFGRVKLKGCTDIPEYNTYDIKCSENWDDDDVDDVKPNIYQLAPNMVPDNISEKSEMDSGIDVQDLSEVEFNDPEDRRSTRTHQGRDRRQNTPVRKPKQAPSVFQYSLRMAGVKQGRSLPGQPAPRILQDSGIGESLASEAFEDEILDSKLPDARPSGRCKAPENFGHQNNSGIRETLACETLEHEISDSKPLDVRPKMKYGTQDVRPKVKHETQDVRPKVKHETQDVRAKVKHETQDVRAKVKHETQDVRAKVRKGLDKGSRHHLNTGLNSRAISKTNKNLETDVLPKVSPFQSRDFDFSSPENKHKKDISSSENCGNLVPPKIPSSQLSPGAGRGAILQYLISNNSPNLSPTGHAPKPETLSPHGPLSQGIGRGALAQYILGKIPAESGLDATPSLNTRRSPGVSPQGLGRGMLAQILNDKRVPANTHLKSTLTADTSQRQNQVPENSEPIATTPKGVPKVLDHEKLFQNLNDKTVPTDSEPKEIRKGTPKVPANSEPKVMELASVPQVLGHGWLGSKRGLANPDTQISRVEESDDEEDLILKFEGIGRGARLKNGNQDPRLYPPSIGSSWSNKNFEYAKN